MAPTIRCLVSRRSMVQSEIAKGIDQAMQSYNPALRHLLPPLLLPLPLLLPVLVMPTRKRSREWIPQALLVSLGLLLLIRMRSLLLI